MLTQEENNAIIGLRNKLKKSDMNRKQFRLNPNCKVSEKSGKGQSN